MPLDGTNYVAPEWKNNGGTAFSAQELNAISQTLVQLQNAAMDSDVFIATYGETTSAEIEAAYQARKVVECIYNDNVYLLDRRLSSTKHVFTTFYSSSTIVGATSYFRKISCSDDSWALSTNLGLFPSIHASSHASGGNDPITPASIGAATPPKYVAVTLTADGWDATELTQTVAAAGVLADETAQLIQPMPSKASQSAYYAAAILCTGQAADSLTFTATTAPTEDLTVYVVVQEVTPA